MMNEGRKRIGRRAVLLFATIMGALTVSGGVALSVTESARALPPVFGVFTVTNISDPGEGVCDAACNLREAITAANNKPGFDIIRFNIPGTGVRSFNVGYNGNGELPEITDPAYIDGYSRPGSSMNTRKVGTNAKPMIELDGSDANGDGSGLEVVASGTVVRGLMINNFSKAGIQVHGTSTTDVSIEGNFIGTDPTGTQSRGAMQEGISIIGPDNVVGGDSAAAANTIAFNNGPGVHISFDESKGNRMLGNSIFSNAGRGIDLGSGDIEGREQDSYDGDCGPNNLQNFPFVTLARTSGTKTTVKGELYSIPNQTFVVRFFSNPPDTDEGKKFIGKKEIITSVDGIRSFALVPARRVGVGRTITATATGPGGNTSEFSAPRKVVAS